ncbi:MAG: ribosomal protein S18-alanine N-acetyltransferase [Eubacteriales bacterium]|nr:ribosomal protein S18-alanine N-acetyltransferase [Eubacteriales bacterium]
MSIIIRRMREEDIPQAVEIEKSAFTRPWSKSIFKATLLLPYAAYYVAAEQPENPEQTADQADQADQPDHEQYKGRENKAEGAPKEDPEQTEDREKIVGICGVKKIFEEGDISNVAVHPDYRRKGICRRMLETLLSEARNDGVTDFTLEVRAGNTPAVRLYESLGFRTEGIRPGFYDHPVEDGLIMWLRK